MGPEALALLEDTMRVMAGNDEAAEEADERFHLLIAENSGSPIIEHFVRTLWRMRNEAPRVVQVYSNVCKSGFEDRIEEHRAVYDAIRNRDPNAARLAMREHFSRLFEAMLAAEETEAIVQLRRKALQHRDRFKLSVQPGAA
jgi:DNA-binding FadR family transcriptional regulator